MTTDLEQRIRQHLDRATIAEAIATHSAGLDRADTALLTRAYAPTATVEIDGFSGHAAEYIARAINFRFGKPISHHRVCHSAIGVSGGEARAESYITITSEIPDAVGNRQRFAVGRYLDRFTRANGAWKISQRRFVIDSQRTQASTNLWPEVDYFMPRGGQRSADVGRALISEWTVDLQPATWAEKDTMTMQSKDSDIELLLAREALKELTVAFGRGIDRGDADLIATALHPDATISMGPVRGTGRDAAAALASSVRTNLKRSHHAISNQWFEIRGDRAVGETYVFAVIALDAEGVELEATNGGRYLDRFEKRQGVWKIAHRTLVMDFVSAIPTMQADREALATAEMRGRFGTDDPSYSLWRDWPPR